MAIVTVVVESVIDELMAYFGRERASIFGKTISINLPIAVMRLLPVRIPIAIRSLPVCPMRYTATLELSAISGAVNVEKNIITPISMSSLILIVRSESRMSGDIVIPFIAIIARSAIDSIPTSSSITIASPRNLPIRNSWRSIGFERIR